tara:strand:+ start:408 stop:788 length:381 start_codon:yes stop_codon:yes gene_type:complete
MNNNWCNIPDAIWIKIFKYDSTYYKIYSNLLNEFKEKMSFWRLKWNNETSNIVYKYISNQKNILLILNYWENDKFRYNDHLKYKPVELFITDEEEGCHFKILNHLKDTKGYIWDDKNNSLYKPNSL